MNRPKSVRHTIRSYAGVTPKVPFNAIELSLIHLMSDVQARQNCYQLCREGELRRVERGVYQATARLRV